MHAFINPNARQRRYFLTLSIVILLLLVCCESVFAVYAEFYSELYSYVNDPNYDSSTEFLTNSSTILLIIGCVMLIVAIAGFIIAWRKKHFLTLHIAISFVILLTCVHGFIMLVHDNTIYTEWGVIQGSAQGSALLVTCAALVIVYFLGFIIKERETDNGKHMLITSGALVLLTLCGIAFRKTITASETIVIVSLAVFHLLHYCMKMPWYSELIYAGVISFLGVLAFSDALGLLLFFTGYELLLIFYELLLILLYDIAVVIITLSLKMRKKLQMTKTDTALEQLTKLYSSGALTQEEYKNELTKYFGGN